MGALVARPNQRAKMFKSDKVNQRVIKILESMKCVARLMVSTILAELPEL
jgi:ribosomal protein L34E